MVAWPIISNITMIHRKQGEMFYDIGVSLLFLANDVFAVGADGFLRCRRYADEFRMPVSSRGAISHEVVVTASC